MITTAGLYGCGAFMFGLGVLVGIAGNNAWHGRDVEPSDEDWLGPTYGDDE